LKGDIDKLAKRVKMLADKIDNVASKKSHQDLDAKVEGIISANSLKRKPG